jgi:hypothetical protein
MVSLVLVLLAVGCAHGPRFTPGQDYTLKVGTYLIATRIGEGASLYQEYCTDKERNDEAEQGCAQIVEDAKEFCSNLQYDFLKEIAADQETYDYIENACKTIPTK